MMSYKSTKNTSVISNVDMEIQLNVVHCESTDIRSYVDIPVWCSRCLMGHYKHKDSTIDWCRICIIEFAAWWGMLHFLHWLTGEDLCTKE